MNAQVSAMGPRFGHPHADQNRAVIEKVYAAAAAGDFADIEALLADDVVLVRCDNHPTPGVCTGKPAVLARLGELFQALRTTGVEVREVVANGPHRVVGIMDALGTDVHGQPYSMPSPSCSWSTTVRSPSCAPTTTTWSSCAPSSERPHDDRPRRHRCLLH
jgi:ketosteroid isomerase-like protein